LDSLSIMASEIQIAEQQLLSNDFVWLEDIINQLRNFTPKLTEQMDQCKKYAAVAVVIRVKPVSSSTTTEMEAKEYKDINQFSKDENIRRGQVQFLYIKRAIRQNDPWSGDVSFPGGKKAPRESAKDCAIRETKEELNIDLSSPQFYFLGELTPSMPDRGALNFLVYSFVWLQLSTGSIPFTLQPSEIAAAFWVPLSMFSDSGNIVTHQGKILKHYAIQLSPVELQSSSKDSSDMSQLHLWGLTMIFTVQLLSVSPKFDFTSILNIKDKLRQYYPKELDTEKLSLYRPIYPKSRRKIAAAL